MRFPDFVLGLLLVALFLLLAPLPSYFLRPSPPVWPVARLELPVGGVLPLATPGKYEFLNLSPTSVQIEGIPRTFAPGLPGGFEQTGALGGIVRRGPSSVTFPSRTIRVAPQAKAVFQRLQCSLCVRTRPHVLHIPAGQHEVSSTIYVPSSFKLKLAPGARLHFHPGTGLLALGGVEVRGTATSPVVLDGESWLGVALVSQNTKNAVSLHHLVIKGARGWSTSGLFFTGGLAIIGAELDASHLVLLDARGEDAINLKYTEGAVDHLVIKDAFSDAIDTDWCDLRISFAEVEGAGNDCFDFSGGHVVLTDSRGSGCGDKGISNGEKNHLRIERITIDGAHHGIVNKDGSTLQEVDVGLRNVKISRDAYIKKHFFGYGL